MLSSEKQKLTNFISIAGDFLYSGYKNVQIDYNLKENTTISSKNDINLTSVSTDTIEKITDEIKVCKNCVLAGTRTNAAAGEGVMQPIVMVIGEGPGRDEDLQGRPFVGAAGQLLDKMLSSIGLSRDTNTFIANIVKCRPPSNRDPHPEEASACAHFLERQILVLKPKFILASGRIAAQTLLKTGEPIGKLRGGFKEFKTGGFNFPLLVTYHPAALLRSEDLKRPAWEDLKLLKSRIEAANEGDPAKTGGN